jgi:hypothetical protein
MTILELSQRPLAGAHPLIIEAIQKLTEVGNGCDEPDLLENHIADSGDQKVFDNLRRKSLRARKTSMLRPSNRF